MITDIPLVKTCQNCTRIKGGQSCRQFPDCQPLSRTGWKGQALKQSKHASGQARIARMPKVALEGIRHAPGEASQSAGRRDPAICAFSHQPGETKQP
jgi:hypothetical protein